ncbi:MAG: cysteine desulfurase [Actinobacteria bacterium]|jgi:cysteine desulfurase|nr:MAG: cysteine desulfurase [Actinomycetota bacterium]
MNQRSVSAGNTEAGKPVYLDYNATTPTDPDVAEAMRPYLAEYFGNPSSSYSYGIQTKDAIENARAQVAALLECQPHEVVFTSGGTESNNFAIKGTAFANRDRGNHVVTAQIEHPAVTQVCEYLERQGFDITYLQVDEFGLISVSDVEKAISGRTTLITIMHANNEVGTIQPIEQISRLASEKGVTFHTDAAQSAGKIPVSVGDLGVDLLSLAGHKIYAPKGIGALYIRQGLRLEKFMHGAGQERGMRAGTENILGIVGLGKACEIAKRDLSRNASRMRDMRDALYKGLFESLENVRLNGHPERRLPNTLSFSIQGVQSDVLLGKIKGRLAASAGAACHSGEVDISHVLRAMKVPEDWARGTIRLSTGKMTTESDIETAIRIIADAVSSLRDTADGSSMKRRL